MSQTVIFSVGFAVFALTVWGAIMAGGIWFAQLAQYDDDDREAPGLAFTERAPGDVINSRRRLSDD